VRNLVLLDITSDSHWPRYRYSIHYETQSGGKSTSPSDKFSLSVRIGMETDLDVAEIPGRIARQAETGWCSSRRVRESSHHFTRYTPLARASTMKAPVKGITPYLVKNRMTARRADTGDARRILPVPFQCRFVLLRAITP
jgi:hypothetical protein